MRVIGQKNIFPAVFLILAAAPLWSQGRVPDLTISKVHNGSFAVGQVGATYTIVVRNIGSAPTSGPVTVTDTLPAGLTATSIGGEGWTCTQPVGPCQRIDILGPRESYSALTLTVNVTRRTGGVVTNTVTVSGGGDSFEGNNEAEDPTDIYSGSLDLAISKRHFGVFTQGQTGATYQIQVINVGQGPTTGTTTVTDTLPAGLTPISINGIGWTCTQPAGPCTRSDALPGGGTPYPVLILTVNVDSTVSGQVTNIAKVSTVGDPNPDNDTALDPTTIASTAPVDLRIRKTHLGDFTPGQMAATYTIVVDNVGQGHTSGTATVTETLPAGLTATSLSGPGWSCQQPSGPCTRNDTLQSGGSYPALTLMVNVSPNATGPVTNVVKVSLAGDTNSNNDTANDVTNIIVLGPDLRIQKSHTGNFFFGQTAIYTLQVDNVGQGPTSGSVSVSDAPPAGLTITAMTGSGWTCAQPAGPCTRNDALAASAAYPPITVTVTVSNNASSNVVNSATVSGGGDTNTNNNTASDPTTILGITGCPAPESPHPYPSNFDFTWTCTLTGTPASVDVTFDALTFVADGDFIYITDANGNNIPGSPFTGTALAGKTVNVPGSVAKIRLTSNGTTEGYGLKVTNIVGVGASTPADLTITKTHTGDFYQAQVGAQYSIVVRNNGSSPTSGVVTVTDTLPAGLSATGISGQGWTCAQPSGPCTRNDALAANSAYPALTLTVNVAVNALSAVANIASVSGGGDTTPANNSASDSTNVLVPTADCQGPLGPLPPGNYPESNHPYDNDATQKWTCVQKGNPAGIAVTFDPASFIDSSDFVSITDKNNNPVPGSPFTADSLQGRIINVPGNTVNITLVSDNRRNAYGFKVTKIASLASPDPDLTLEIIRDAVANGVILIRAGLFSNCIRLLPPIVMTDEQLNEGLSVLEAAIAKAHVKRNA